MHCVDINLPGVCVESGNAMLFSLAVAATPNDQRTYHAEGALATALLPLLIRVSDISEALGWSVGYSGALRITLSSNNSDIEVQDADSAGLSMAIALENLKRLHSGRAPAVGVVGSGAVYQNGYIGDISYYKQKKSVVLSDPSTNRFLTCRQVPHLLALSSVLFL